MSKGFPGLDKAVRLADPADGHFGRMQNPDRNGVEGDAKALAFYYFHLAMIYEARARKLRGSAQWRARIALSRLAGGMFPRWLHPLYSAEEYIKTARQRAGKLARKDRNVEIDAIPAPPVFDEIEYALVNGSVAGGGDSTIFRDLCGKSMSDIFRTVKSYVTRDDIVFVTRFRRWLRANPEAAGDKVVSVLDLADIIVDNRNGLYSLQTRKCAAFLEKYGAQPFVLASMWQEFFDIYANALARVGKAGEAIDVLNRGSSRLGEPPALLRKKASIHAWAGDAKSALKELGRLEADLLTFSPRDQILKAFLLETQGDHELARFELERALRRPNCPSDAHLMISNVALKQGDLALSKMSIDKCFASYALRGIAFANADRPLALPNIVNIRPPRNNWGSLVTVIMTAYQAEATIGFAVESVLAQSHSNLQLVVVEDSGDDSTLNILKKLAKADDRMTVVANKANVGTYRSKNSVLASARGSYVTFHDSDDWWHPDHIQEHLKFMSLRTELVASTSRWARIDEEGRFLLSRSGLILHHNPASMFVQKSVFDEIGGFDANTTGADSEFLQRMRTVFGPNAVGVLHKPLAFGLHRADSLTQSGTAAYDENRYSPVREAYRAQWLEWQRQSAGGRKKLHISFEEHVSRFSEAETA
jgi:tetratricopeptide (TPR) repeat protein